MTGARYMQRALELARRGINTSFPNPRVGCVIVRDGQIVGEGFHEKAGDAHAEIMALQSAGDKAVGASMYVTLEPCNHHGRTPPCSEALIAAGVKEVFYAVSDTTVQASGGAKRLERGGIAVHSGLCAAVARELNEHFFHRVSRARPWFTAKLAMSIDGRTALANRQSQWITGQPSRTDVHLLRTEFQAILTGIGTVLSDNPALTARHVEAKRQPTRILIDAWLDAPIDAKLFVPNAEVIVCCSKNADCQRVEALEEKGVTVWNRFSTNERNRLLLTEVSTALGEHQINSVLLECGSYLATAFMDEDLIDELIVYVGNTIIGVDGYPLLRQKSPEAMVQLSRFRLHGVRQFEDDVRLQYRKEQ